MQPTDLQPNQRTARLAGAVYLLCALTAPFGLLYVPGKLIIKGDPAATAHNILASETLFRASIVTDLISTTAFAIAVLLLYRLLHGVSKLQAWLMVMLALVSVPISLVDTASDLAALTLLHRPEFLGAFDQRQVEALAMLLLGLGSRTAVAEMFWGLWLFPFGWLVWRSGFLPRILGGLLIANGVAYVALSLAALLFPAHADAVQRVALPLEMGELWIMLWLVIMGVKRQPQLVAAPA